MSIFSKVFHRFHNLKLRNKLLFSFSFVSVITLIIFGIMSSYFIRSMIVEREGEVMQKQIEYFTNILDIYFKNIDKSSQVLIYSDKVQRLFDQNINLLEGVERVQAYNDIYYQIHQMWDNVYGLDGIYLIDQFHNVFDVKLLNVYSSFVVKEMIDKRLLSEGENADKGSSKWSFVEWSDQRTSIFLTQAIYNRTNLTLIGYLVVAVNPEVLNTFLSAAHLAEGSTSVMDANGFVFSDAGEDNDIKQVIDNNAWAGTSGHKLEKMNGESYMIVHYQYPLTDWALIYSVKLSILLQNISSINTLWFLLMLVSLLIMTIIAFLISKTISSPILRMVKSIREVERGNLFAEFKHTYQDEFGLLGSSFNHMIAKIREGTPLLREKFIRSLFERNLSPDELRAFEKQLNFQFEHTDFQAALLYIHGSTNAGLNQVEMLLNECETNYAMISNLIAGNQYCLVFNCSQKTVSGALAELVESIRQKTNLSAYAFIGNAYDHINLIKTSFDEAKTLMKYVIKDQMENGNQQMYWASDAFKGHYPESFENRLVYYINDGNLAECAAVMNELMEYAKSNNLATPVLNTFFVAMYHYLNKLGSKYAGGRSGLASVDLFADLAQRLQYEPLERTCQDFLQHCEAYMKATGTKAEAPSPHMAQAIKIIEGNFSNPELSAEYMARKLGLSNNYFSQIFKKETGTGFIEYVAKVRLDAAKKMLQEEMGTKVKEIAGRVGFQDPHYFGSWFKENVGLSPMQFRKQMNMNSSKLRQ